MYISILLFLEHVTTGHIGIIFSLYFLLVLLVIKYNNHKNYNNNNKIH